MTTLEDVIPLGYVRSDQTPKDVRSAYQWHCRQHARPYIWISYRPSQSSRCRGDFGVLMSIEETMKPTRKTTAQVTKLRKAWSERLVPDRKDGKPKGELDFNAKEAGVPCLTEDQAVALAAELWAIVGQDGAYTYVEPADEDEEDEGDD